MPLSRNPDIFFSHEIFHVYKKKKSYVVWHPNNHSKELDINEKVMRRRHKVKSK